MVVVEYAAEPYASQELSYEQKSIGIFQSIRYNPGMNEVKVLLYKIKNGDRILNMTATINLLDYEQDCLTKSWVPLEDIADVIYDGCYGEIEISILTVTPQAVERVDSIDQ